MLICSTSSKSNSHFDLNEETTLDTHLSKELARKRAQLAPEISAAFKTFSHLLQQHQFLRRVGTQTSEWSVR
jgi:hypothetical protein